MCPINPLLSVKKDNLFYLKHCIITNFPGNREKAGDSPLCFIWKIIHIRTQDRQGHNQNFIFTKQSFHLYAKGEVLIFSFSCSTTLSLYFLIISIDFSLPHCTFRLSRGERQSLMSTSLGKFLTLSTRVSTTLWCPPLNAAMRQLVFLLLLLSGSAPSDSSDFTKSRNPDCAAKNKLESLSSFSWSTSSLLFSPSSKL